MGKQHYGRTHQQSVKQWGNDAFCNPGQCELRYCFAGVPGNDVYIGKRIRTRLQHIPVMPNGIDANRNVMAANFFHISAEKK